MESTASLIVKNINDIELVQHLTECIPGIVFNKGFSSPLFNCQLSVLNLTNEFRYTYDFMKERKLLEGEYFFGRIYDYTQNYCSIDIECMDYSYKSLARIMTDLIGESIYIKFKTEICFIIGEEDPYKILK